jgi:predicted Zn-dependent protease
MGMQIPRSRWWAALPLLILLPTLALASPGQRAYKDFVEQDLIYPDDEWQSYVQAVGERLVAVSRRPNADFHFHIIDSDAVNAMAFPDGYIFIHRGLLAFLESEDQLAAVIGHEIAHVAADHARKRNLMGAFGAITGFVGAVLTGRGELMSVSNAATNAMTAGYGREMEIEADQLGAEYLARVGYNPMAMIEVIQVLKDQELFANQFGNSRQTYHGLFSTHPKNDRRLHDAVQKAAGDIPAQLVDPVADFWTLMDGLTFGNQAAVGVVRDHTYYHGRLRFVVEFPAGWQVSTSTTQVSGRAPGGGDQGLISLQRQQAELGAHTPEGYIRDVLNREDLIGGDATTVNGYQAFIGELEPGNGRAANLIATLFKDGAVYLFRGETGAGADAEAFASDFRATVESFRTMTGADVRTANDQRIRVIEARPGDTYASLARRSSLQEQAESTLRLLNGDHPVGEPRAGDFVKIVE